MATAIMRHIGAISFRRGDIVRVRDSEFLSGGEWEGHVLHVNGVGQPYVCDRAGRRSPKYLFNELIAIIGHESLPEE